MHLLGAFDWNLLHNPQYSPQHPTSSLAALRLIFSPPAHLPLSASDDEAKPPSGRGRPFFGTSRMWIFFADMI
jgi:hypothetical protein